MNIPILISHCNLNSYHSSYVQKLQTFRKIKARNIWLKQNPVFPNTLLDLLGFDDYTYLNECIFRDWLQINIRSWLRSLMVPMTWSMNMYSSKESKEVRKGILLRMSNIDMRSIVPKFDDLTLLEIGDCALFPDWCQEIKRVLEFWLLLYFLIFSWCIG